MTPLLANALNIPLILILGFIILVPLMAFEICVESAILRRAWKLDWDHIRFTFKANIWSLIAGIPVKFLNAFIYESKLPKDLPSFLEAYPFWIAVGAAIYFVVTVVVETLCSLHFANTGYAEINKKRLFSGILIANVATYAVLAPLHYWITKPKPQISEFLHDTKWAQHPGITIVYIDPASQHLKARNLDGANERTIAPFPVQDYLVSESLDTCLFQSAEGYIHLYRPKTSENKQVLQTTPTSPSARHHSVHLVRSWPISEINSS